MLAGGAKSFRGRQKLEKGAQNVIINDARTPFVGRNSEFGKTEELFNSLGVASCTASSSMAVSAGSVSVIEHLLPHPLSSKLV